MKQFVDFAIICALEEEAEEVRKRLGSVIHENPSGKIGRWDFQLFDTKSDRSNQRPARVVLISLLNQMGNFASLKATSLLISKFEPRFVLLVGICGALIDEDFNLGDVVVSNEVIFYESAKIKEEEIEYRDVKYSSENSFLLNEALSRILAGWNSSERIDALYPGNGNNRYRPKVKHGIVASGEKVIAKKSLASEIKNLNPEIISVEMEAAGVAYACKESDADFLIIKAASDYADENKNHENGFRKYAKSTAAAFACYFIEKFDLDNYPQRTTLASLLKLIPGGKTKIIVPAFEEIPSERNGIENYCMSKWRADYDDLYCALRIITDIESASGRNNVDFFFHKDEQAGANGYANTIILGSERSNTYTREVFEDNHAFFRYGSDDDFDHMRTIYGDYGKSENYYELRCTKNGREKRVVIGDYSLISVFRKANTCTVVLSGLIAYGQYFIGDYLSNTNRIRELYNLISEGDFQCLIEVDVVRYNRTRFRCIKELRVRASDKNKWRRIPID